MFEAGTIDTENGNSNRPCQPTIYGMCIHDKLSISVTHNLSYASLTAIQGPTWSRIAQLDAKQVRRQQTQRANRTWPA